MNIQDKVALITGSGRGMGRAISLGLAKNGVKVALTGRNQSLLDKTAKEIEEAGGNAKTFLLDVTDDRQAESVSKEVYEEWGSIDILVNNAGVIVYDKPVWETTLEEWNFIMDTNLKGTFLTCKAVLPYMMQKGAGYIINIGSSSGKEPDDEYGPYAASKWGVVGYTASLAKSLIGQGIIVNGINPTWVDTDMARAYIPEGDPDWVTQNEISDAVIYLLTKAPKAMTGKFIDIF
ncbi:MAG: SDR family oxidoreductase [Dehalococcoidia bacterium]|nr:SDR family oxidoreductase [Dehalococcoidia bacterium]